MPRQSTSQSREPGSVVEWLESPEGERWSRSFNFPGAWGPGGLMHLEEQVFFELKSDMEIIYPPSELDAVILREIELYGMTGLPRE